MRKIIYYSKTGYTEKYAKLLGNILNIEVIPFTQIRTVDTSTELIFMSWVCANHIKKLKGILKKYNIICVIAVGMNFETENNTKILIDTNKVSVPFFYLHGGLDYDKLHGFSKVLIKMVAKQVISENKPENKDIIEVFKHGGNFVAIENLANAEKYLRK